VIYEKKIKQIKEIKEKKQRIYIMTELEELLAKEQELVNKLPKSEGGNYKRFPFGTVKTSEVLLDKSTRPVTYKTLYIYLGRPEDKIDWISDDFINSCVTFDEVDIKSNKMYSVTKDHLDKPLLIKCYDSEDKLRYSYIIVLQEETVFKPYLIKDGDKISFISHSISQLITDGEGYNDSFTYNRSEADVITLFKGIYFGNTSYMRDKIIINANNNLKHIFKAKFLAPVIVKSEFFTLPILLIMANPYGTHISKLQDGFKFLSFKTHNSIEVKVKETIIGYLQPAQYSRDKDEDIIRLIKLRGGCLEAISFNSKSLIDSKYNKLRGLTDGIKPEGGVFKDGFKPEEKIVSENVYDPNKTSTQQVVKTQKINKTVENEDIILDDEIPF
jgi:hypothetical protein